PPAPPDAPTLSLHDALPIWVAHGTTHEAARRGERLLGLRPSRPRAHHDDRELHAAARRVDRGPRRHAIDPAALHHDALAPVAQLDRKSTRLNSSHVAISYAV